MKAPTKPEREAARQILRSWGGHRRAEILSERQLSAIGKKANKASQLAKKRKKLANNA